MNGYAVGPTREVLHRPPVMMGHVQASGLRVCSQNEIDEDEQWQPDCKSGRQVVGERKGKQCACAALKQQPDTREQAMLTVLRVSDHD